VFITRSIRLRFAPAQYPLTSPKQQRSTIPRGMLLSAYCFQAPNGIRTRCEPQWVGPWATIGPNIPDEACDAAGIATRRIAWRRRHSRALPDEDATSAPRSPQQSQRHKATANGESQPNRPAPEGFSNNFATAARSSTRVNGLGRSKSARDAGRSGMYSLRASARSQR